MCNARYVNIIKVTSVPFIKVFHIEDGARSDMTLKRMDSWLNDNLNKFADYCVLFNQNYCKRSVGLYKQNTEPILYQSNSRSTLYSTLSFLFYYNLYWYDVSRLRCMCNSTTLDRPLAHTRARTRDLLHTSTVTLEASLPIAPRKPRPLQSKGNYYFKVSEQVTSLIETLFSAHAN